MLIKTAVLHIILNKAKSILPSIFCMMNLVWNDVIVKLFILIMSVCTAIHNLDLVLYLHVENCGAFTLKILNLVITNFQI